MCRGSKGRWNLGASSRFNRSATRRQLSPSTIQCSITISREGLERIGRFLAFSCLIPSNPRSLGRRDMNEIAADYVRLIREAQPHGSLYPVWTLCSGSHRL